MTQSDIDKQLEKMQSSSDDLTLDSDYDGLSDAEEMMYGTSPYVSDIDGDGVVDGREIATGGNPKQQELEEELEEQYDYEYFPEQLEHGSARQQARDDYLNKAKEQLGLDTLTYEDLYQEGNDLLFFEALDVEVVRNSPASERIQLLSQSPYVQFQKKENKVDLPTLFESHVRFVDLVADYSQQLDHSQEKVQDEVIEKEQEKERSLDERKFF